MCPSITRILNDGSTTQQLGKLGREFAEQIRERSDFWGFSGDASLNNIRRVILPVLLIVRRETDAFDPL